MNSWPLCKLAHCEGENIMNYLARNYLVVWNHLEQNYMIVRNYLVQH